jgi:hypothetical protein
MKRKFGSVWVLLLVMGLMVMTGGCGGGGDGNDENDEPESEVSVPFFVVSGDHVFLDEASVINPNVNGVEISEILSVFYEKESDRDHAVAAREMTLSNTGKNYTVGDVIVVPPSEKSTHGFAAVVEFASSGNNGTQILSLRQASIGDILTQGNLIFSAHESVDSIFQRAGVVSPQSLKATHIYPQGLIDDAIDRVMDAIDIYREFETPLPEISIKVGPSFNAELAEQLSKKASFKADFKLELSASVILKPGLSTLISVEDAQLKRFKLAFPYELTKKIAGKFSGKVSVNTDNVTIGPKIPVYKSAFVIPLPVFPFGVPIPYSVDYSTVVDAALAYEQDITLYESASSSTIKGIVGFNFKDDEWSSISEKSEESAEEPQKPSGINSNAEIKVAVGPKLSFALCGAEIVSAKATGGGAVKWDMTERKTTFRLNGTHISQFIKIIKYF